MRTDPLLSFNNEQKVKDKLVDQLRKQAFFNQITQGDFAWKDGVGGSFIGCSIYSGYAAALEAYSGIPLRLIWLSESLFRNMAFNDAVLFARDYYTWVPVGVDLHKRVFIPFILWMLADSKEGVIRFTKEGSDIRREIEVIIELCKRARFYPVTTEEWAMAENASLSLALIDSPPTPSSYAACAASDSARAMIDSELSVYYHCHAAEAIHAFEGGNDFNDTKIKVYKRMADKLQELYLFAK